MDAVKYMCRMRSLIRMYSLSVSFRSDNGGTPLHFAAYNDQGDTVRKLVELGASLEAPNRSHL
jgi:ankyrin repeat protein